MNEEIEYSAIEAENSTKALEVTRQDIPDQDDRYPGSFFRIPGVPVPGKTTWSLN
ncbi:MAG: hypothetical protein HOP23_00315 [Methylococcaceae bacterium]|nr:hypothetical protein [Methylococcaceae bacterium]